MQFTLTIDCGNAAFDEDLLGELSRILRTTADAVQRGEYDGRCHDTNGNRVGQHSMLGTATLGAHGDKLATVLGLKRNEVNRYDTTWGDKTNLGLALTVQRILIEGA